MALAAGPLAGAAFGKEAAAKKPPETVVKRLYDSLNEKQRDYQTIKTMLDRMAAKGYLAVEKLGPLCLFSPAVKRSQAVALAIDEFVGTVLDDTLAPLLVHLANDGKMSPEELDELEKILSERKRENGK